MNVLIDICHPAHVHLLRNTYFELVKNNHVVLVTVKDIPSAKQLLDLFGIQYIEIGATHDSLIKKAIAQLKYNWKLFRLVKKHKINIGIGSSSTLTHISKVTSMHSIFLDDDDDQVQPLTVKYAHPYADVILSPDVLRGKRGRKDCIYYEGYHELAYLHPDRFTPDENVLSELGLKKEDTYFIMRFNAFMAHHDVGIQGLRLENKLRLIAMKSF